MEMWHACGPRGQKMRAVGIGDQHIDPGALSALASPVAKIEPPTMISPACRPGQPRATGASVNPFSTTVAMTSTKASGTIIARPRFRP